ncbi:Glutathione S-transferase [Defluviimonas aquaemixtae]|uniref:glutathione transferase n=1 Tax=Albidovulum aquaemixtae TaxID=1542388 RepID=A0A2R8BNL4_9RHOB|nr:glutathione S-transferase family protein [Defluviimonas aquaemixtae]SPH24963.1 Glutathione S-transferase [Defluviimonas aquaemixtae]
MSKITLHGFAPSTYTRTARMGAIESGIDHDLVPLAYGEPAHLALHPFGKMPILTNGSATVYETLAILDYLDHLNGSPRLFGDSGAERAQIMAAVSAAIDYAYRAVVKIDAEDEPNAAQSAEAAKVFDWLEYSLSETRHVASETLSAADLFFAPMLAYHQSKWGAERIRNGRPRLAAWMDAIARRPSFAQTGG